MAVSVDIFDSLGTDQFLVNTFDDKVIKEPLGNSQIVKYTCIAASNKYIALGANSGGIYCFHRDPLKYVRLLTNKEGQIRQLCFAPDGNRVAAVCGDHLVVVWELNLEEHGISKRYYTSAILTGGVIQDICWGPKSARVYAGDDRGQVAVLYMPKASRVIDPFKRLDEVIFQDQGPVVQMDCLGELVLVSLWTRCVLLKLGVKGLEVVQVGKKLREGLYGACFSHSQSMKPKIYATRPSMRVWEAGLNGKVSLTHRLKELLSVPPSPILGHQVLPDLSPSKTTYSGPTTSSRVLVSKEQMVLWSGSAVIVFSSFERRLIGWYLTRGDISNVCCHGDHIYMVANDGEDVYKLKIQSLRETLLSLASMDLNVQVVKLSALQSSNIILNFYQDAEIKETITRARLLVRKEEVEGQELARVESLLSSEDWMIVPVKKGSSPSKHDNVTNRKEVVGSQQEVISKAQEETPVTSKGVMSLKNDRKEVLVDRKYDSTQEMVAAKTETALEIGTLAKTGKMEVGTEMGVDLEETNNRDEPVAVDTPIAAQDGSSEDTPSTTIKNVPTLAPPTGNTETPPTAVTKAPPTTVTKAPPTAVTKAPLTMVTGDTPSPSAGLDPHTSELEASTAELTTPLRSWSFKKETKEELKYTDFAPIRVTKPKQPKRQHSMPASLGISQSIDSRRTIHQKSDSLPDEDYHKNHLVSPPEVPSTQIVNQGTSCEQEVLVKQEVSVIQEVDELSTATQKGTLPSSQEVTNPHVTLQSQEVTNSSLESQEVTTSHTSLPSQEVSTSSILSQEMQQEVSGYCRDTFSGTSPQSTDDSSIPFNLSSAQEKGVLDGPLPPGSDLRLLPLSESDEKTHDPRERTETPAEMDMMEGETTTQDNQLIGSSEARLTSDSLSGSTKTNKTTFLSKMKTLAGKGRDRFVSSEIGSKVEAELEKKATKMKEILSSLAVPPPGQKGALATREDMTGSDVTTAGTPITGSDVIDSPPEKPPLTEGLEDVDGKSKYGQLVDITNIVNLTVSDLILDGEVAPVVTHLYKWMENLLTTIQHATSRGREMVDGGDPTTGTEVVGRGDPMAGAKVVGSSDLTTGTKVVDRGDPTAGTKVVDRGDPTTGTKVVDSSDLTTGTEVIDRGDPTTGTNETINGSTPEDTLGVIGGDEPACDGETSIPDATSNSNVENRSRNTSTPLCVEESGDVTEDIDGPMLPWLRKKKPRDLLSAKLVHDWFNHAHFGGKFMDVVRTLLHLFLQMADFTDLSNSFVKFYKDASVDLSVDLSDFVEVFSGVLDVPLLMDHLINLDLELRRTCWRSLMKGLGALVEDGDDVVKKINRKQCSPEAVINTINGRFFPLYLNLLFQQDLKTAISVCVQSLSSLSPWIPLFALLDVLASTQQQMPPSDGRDLLLTPEYVTESMVYVERVLAADKQTVMLHLSGDGDLLIHLASVYLRAKVSSDSFSHMDSEGKPIMHSHCLLWQQDANLASMTTIAITTNKEQDIVKLYKKEGFWLGCLQLWSHLLKKASSRTTLYRSAVETVCYLGDLSLLKEYDLLPRDTVQGKILLRVGCHVFGKRGKSPVKSPSRSFGHPSTRSKDSTSSTPSSPTNMGKGGRVGGTALLEGSSPSTGSIPLAGSTPPKGSTSPKVSTPLTGSAPPTGSTPQTGSTPLVVGNKSSPLSSSDYSPQSTAGSMSQPRGSSESLPGSTSPQTGSSECQSQATTVPSVPLSNVSSRSCPDAEIIKYLVLSLGSTAVQSILSDLSSCKDLECDWLLSGRLLPGLVRSNHLEAGMTQVCRDILESNDVYMWSPRTAALGPHFTDAYNQVRKGYIEPQGSILSHMNASSLEDSMVHWGTKTEELNTMTCAVCQLGVQSYVSLSVPGVVVLPCGHCYHRNCLSEGACVLCYQHANLFNHF